MLNYQLPSAPVKVSNLVFYFDYLHMTSSPNSPMHVQQKLLLSSVPASESVHNGRDQIKLPGNLSQSWLQIFFSTQGQRYGRHTARTSYPQEKEKSNRSLGSWKGSWFPLYIIPCKTNWREGWCWHNTDNSCGFRISEWWRNRRRAVHRPKEEVPQRS